MSRGLLGLLAGVVSVCCSCVALAQSVDPRPAAGPEPLLNPLPPDDKPALQKLLDGIAHFNKVEGLSVKLDTQAMQNGHAGFSYDAKLERQLGEQNPGIAANRFSISVMSKGFFASEKAASSNSLVHEGRISYQLFGPGFNVHDADGNARRARSALAFYDDLGRWLDDPANGGVDVTGPEFRKLWQDKLTTKPELDYLTGRKASRYLLLDAHVRNEASQDYEDQQWAAGVGLTTDLAIITGDYSIAKIMDAPFALLRSTDNHFTPQLPRLYLGYDYIPNSQVSGRSALTQDDSFHRMNFEFAWKTSVLDNVDVRISWNLLYELGAPTAIHDAGRDVGSFFQISAEVPVGGGTNVFVEFSEGKLPPTLTESSRVGAGLRVRF